jgi:hypothetical protein
MHRIKILITKMPKKRRQMRMKMKSKDLSLENSSPLPSLKERTKKMQNWRILN